MNIDIGVMREPSAKVMEVSYRFIGRQIGSDYLVRAAETAIKIRSIGLP